MSQVATISMFMLCESINQIQTKDGTVPQMMGPLMVLRPPYMPGIFSFSAACAVKGVDLYNPHTLRITIQDPEGNIVYDTGESDMQAIIGNDTLPKEEQGMMLSIDVRNLELKLEGIYKCVIYINSEISGEQNIPIYKRYIQ